MWTLIFLLLLFPFAVGWLSLAPWVPTFPIDRERILSLLPNWKKSFIELGCGMGGVSLAVAKKFPEYRVTAIEIAFPFYLIAKIRQIFSWQKNLHIVFWDALKIHLWEYDIVYIFGLPENMDQKILPKYNKEMKQGSILISYVFTLGEKWIGEKKSYKLENRNTLHSILKK